MTSPIQRQKAERYTGNLRRSVHLPHNSEATLGSAELSGRFERVFAAASPVLSIVISLAALGLAYLSYDVATRAEKRQDEDILISRGACCSLAIEVAYVAGVPVSLYREHDVRISNRSLSSTTITDCHILSESGRSGFAGGIAGSNCSATFALSDGTEIKLPYLLGAGEVILMNFRTDWELGATEQQAYDTFVQSGRPDFIQFLCEEDIATLAISYLVPFDSCLLGKENVFRGRSWLEISTGRGNTFTSVDITQL